MRRRDFVIGLGVAALVSPVAASAQQQPVMPVVGFLTSISPRAIARRLQVFRRALEETGYVEGRNVAIEYRGADGDYGRLPSLADELARLKVTVIVATGGTTTALAAKHATSIIPIVFAAGGDPIKSGLVASLNRPGGNITGVNVLASDLSAKRLELLEELVPKATVIAMLANRNSATAEVNAAAVKEAARRSGRQLVVVKAGAESEFETAFATLVRQRAGALLVDADPFFWTRADALVALAARPAVPAIYNEPEFVTADGLASYGAEHRRRLSPSRCLCRPYFAGRKAGRPAGRAAQQDRADPQPQDRQGARAHDPAIDPRARRRGDRMMARKLVAIWRGHSGGAIDAVQKPQRVKYCVAVTCNLGMLIHFDPDSCRDSFVTSIRVPMLRNSLLS